MLKVEAFRFMTPLAMVLAAGCATITGQEPADETAMRSAPPKEPVFVEADILGRDADALDKLLGAAALVRREGAGEFRRYTLADCTLIVILYPDEAGASAARRIDAAAKTSAAPPPDLAACLAGGLAPAPSS